MEGFSYIFEGVEDPRTSNATRHDLHEMLMIGLLSTLCGGEGCCDMALESLQCRFAAYKSEDEFANLDEYWTGVSQLRLLLPFTEPSVTHSGEVSISYF